MIGIYCLLPALSAIVYFAAPDFVSVAAIRLSIPSLERFGDVVIAEAALVATNNLVSLNNKHLIFSLEFSD